MPMGERRIFWVIGGDRRQAALARALQEDGHEVHAYALEQGVEESLREESLRGIEKAHCVILPLPAGDGVFVNAPLSAQKPAFEEVLDAMSPGQILCGGMVSCAWKQEAEQRGITLTDYFDREELAVSNAVPSSEGAIQIAMEELPITLHGARILILGYGRLGKVLARQLHGLGARVTVSARKYADLAWIRAMGWEAVSSHDLTGILEGRDLILNTVPALILDREALGKVDPGCLVIDLASKPGGVDFEAAEELGVKTVWALGLPGKAAPVTAGLAIRDAIYNILSELGESL